MKTSLIQFNSSITAIVLISFSLFLSCNNDQDKKVGDSSKYDEHIEGRLEKLRLKYGALMDHIPSNSHHFSLTSTNCCIYRPHLVSLHTGCVDSIDSLEMKYRELAIQVYNITDTNNFIILENIGSKEDISHSLKEMQEKYTTSELFRRPSSGRYPIPSFKYVISHSNKHFTCDSVLLNDSFMVYIIESDSGMHYACQDNDFSFQQLDRWSKGYSKGVLISKEQSFISYWMIAW